METIDGGCTSSDGNYLLRDYHVHRVNTISEILDNGDSESHTKKKTKRMRTTFTEEQVQILQANFQIDSNPDGQDLERIAQITGLSKRVTQVSTYSSTARVTRVTRGGHLWPFY